MVFRIKSKAKKKVATVIRPTIKTAKTELERKTPPNEFLYPN